jgi:DNA-binding transcriptional LysR family regulator
MLRKIDWESQIGRRLKLRDLHVFLTVVHCGSMAKAAQQLGVSQPAVSEVIADLEHALGVRLLDRSARGVEPTAYGDALVKRSVAAFDELKQGIRDIEFLSDQTVGEVSISSPPILVRGLAAAAIDKLTRRYPRMACRLKIEEDYRALEERQVDLAIDVLATIPIVPDHMEADILYNSARFVVAAKTNPWSRRRNVKLADLVNEPWALPRPDGPIAAGYAEALQAAGVKLTATVVSESGFARLALVAEGRFLTLATEAAVRFAGRDLPITTLVTDFPEIRIPIGIVTLKNRTLTPVAQLFIETAREVIKPRATGKSVAARRLLPQ